jgi:hypothetical protein
MCWWKVSRVNVRNRFSEMSIWFSDVTEASFTILSCLSALNCSTGFGKLIEVLYLIRRKVNNFFSQPFVLLPFGNSSTFTWFYPKLSTVPYVFTHWYSKDVAEELHPLGEVHVLMCPMMFAWSVQMSLSTILCACRVHLWGPPRWEKETDFQTSNIIFLLPVDWEFFCSALFGWKLWIGKVQLP